MVVLVIAFLLSLQLSVAQVNSLNLAMAKGDEIGYPYTIAALDWAESSFCIRTHHPDGSHGCGGIRLQTAELTEERHVPLDEIDDPAANLAIAAHYFALCLAHSDSWRRAVAEYHYGIPKGSRMSQEEINSNRYVLSVAAKVRALERIKADTQ